MYNTLVNFGASLAYKGALNGKRFKILQGVKQWLADVKPIK